MVVRNSKLNGSVRKCLSGGVLGFLLLGLGGCVTETTHSIYSKEFSADAAVESHTDAAMEYLRKGDTENAVRHLRTAHDIDSGSPLVNNGLALAFQMSGEIELAEKHYKAALRADRNMTAARNNYGVFLYGQGRYDDACQQMRRVIKDTLYEGRTDAFYNLGQCELRLGDVAAAEEAFVRTVALNRTHGPALLELAEISLRQSDYAEAQRYYQSYNMVAEPSPRSLYVGIQLADYFGEHDSRASYALALKNLYPYSEEYIRYKRELSNDAAN